MKPKFKYLVILSIVLSFSPRFLKAQINGCDLCGPASGTYKNVALGNYSATIGAGCESRGQYSFAVGYVAKSYTTNTIAMGKYVRAQAANSIVIGSGVANADSRMLTNNIPNSLMVGFNSCLPTLFVSNSVSYNTTGKVGIGNVSSPKAKLHIKADSNEDAGIFIETSNVSKKAYLQLFDENNLISVDSNTGLSIFSKESQINLDANQVLMNAKVAIEPSKSFPESDYALSVAGGIITTKVMVKEVSEWYDHVFEEMYKLPTIENVQKFIAENGHLPDVPSEQDVMMKGYDMAEMDGILLRKIEELTLYTIELNAIVKRQQEIIESLQSK